jgi:hypothetical protein
MSDPKRERAEKAPDTDYEVGYKKPPKEHRWKDGEGGWPKGKRRPRKAPPSELERVFGRKTHVTIAGQRVEVTATVAIMMRLQAKAAEGDLKSIAEYLKWEQRYAERIHGAGGPVEDEATKEQRLLLAKRFSAFHEGVWELVQMGVLTIAEDGKTIVPDWLRKACVGRGLPTTPRILPRKI